MKKKIIDTNTIEILMNKDDLKKYRITVLDLLGDHQHVQDFFYHLLGEIDDNHQFSSSKHLIFKILPSRNGLELIISKHSDYSNLKFHSKESDKLNGNKSNQTFHRDSIIKLKTFENVIKVSHLIDIHNGISNLYLLNGEYYLELCFHLQANQLNKNIIKNELSLIYEYGNQTHLNHRFLSKNGKKIISGNALEIIYHYFK